jgi:hypothetical protein
VTETSALLWQLFTNLLCCFPRMFFSVFSISIYVPTRYSDAWT